MRHRESVLEFHVTHQAHGFGQMQRINQQRTITGHFYGFSHTNSTPLSGHATSKKFLDQIGLLGFNTPSQF
jgi:hypothetical protein